MIDHEKIIREFKAAESQAADAITGYIRDKVRYIDHIPSMYFLPGAPSGALVQLAKELHEHGRIEMHPDAWVPRCLVDAGIESLPRA